MLHNAHKEWVSYVKSFYSKGGLYDIGATTDEINAATFVRLTDNEYAHLPFDADSLDRELVRDIILSTRNN